MANTVSVLNFTNTFGDLLAQENIIAKELNNLGANNYTKDGGTLYLNGIGTGLSVTNTAALGAGIVSTTLAVGGDTTLLANVYLDAPGFTLQVANNAIIHKQIVTDNITANTLVRTSTLNVTGTAFANNITSNNVVLTSTLNATGTAFVNNLRANNAVTAPFINATTRGFFQDITSNNQITTTFLNVTTNVISDLNVTTDVRGRDFFGRVGTFDSFVAGSMTVSGNFVVSSSTIYSSNSFILNAGAGAGQTSTLGVDRGISGANAAFRWNESLRYWETFDVQNGQFFRVLNNMHLSDSTTLNSSLNVATSAAVNSLQNQVTANTNTFTSNVNTLTTNLAAVSNYSNTSFARANTSANVFTGTTGSSAVATNGRMSFSSNNGVVISATGNTVFVNTPQDLGTLSNPTFNSIYSLGNPLSVDNGGIGASDKVQGLINLLPSTVGVANGSVLAANANTIYWTTRGPFFANNLTFTAPFGGIIAGQNTIQLAIQDLETRKATIASPTFTGTPATPTAANGTNSTQIASTAFVNNSINQALGGGGAGTANINITGNAGTVTNGVYTNGSYANPSFITSLDSSKITGTLTNAVLTTSSYSNPSWLTSLAGSKISGAIPGTAAGVTGFTINQSVGTGDSPRFNSLGVGTPASGTAGEIRATNNITAYFSDDRLKTRLGYIENALGKVSSLTGFYHEANETAQQLGYKPVREVGLSAQDVQKVLPEVVAPAPIDEQYLTIRYERMIPLLVEAIKELKAEVDLLKSKQK
ncbi:tail fiber domain-containing protein [bacterium]|nr:tail fiber domain-containing protein [Candidatus Elulimicrobium humile]